MCEIICQQNEPNANSPELRAGIVSLTARYFRLPCIKEESEHAEVQEKNLLWKLLRYPRVSNIRNRDRETYE